MDGWTWLQLMCCTAWYCRVLYFKVAWVRTTVGRMEVRCIPDWRESERLVSKRIILSRYSNWLYFTLVACFYNYWEQCREAGAARGMSKSETGLRYLQLGWVVLLYVSIQYGCLYQNGKEKNISLCSFVPGGDTAVPCWELWTLACWISAESGGKILWGWGWRSCRKWWKANMPIVSAGLWSAVIKEGVRI